MRAGKQSPCARPLCDVASQRDARNAQRFAPLGQLATGFPHETRAIHAPFASNDQISITQVILQARLLCKDFEAVLQPASEKHSQSKTEPARRASPRPASHARSGL